MLAYNFQQSRVEMFAQLDDDVRQVERAIMSSSYDDGSLKKHRESMVGHEDRVRQGINVIFKELIYKLLTQI